MRAEMGSIALEGQLVWLPPNPASECCIESNIIHIMPLISQCQYHNIKSIRMSVIWAQKFNIQCFEVET